MATKEKNDQKADGGKKGGAKKGGGKKREEGQQAQVEHAGKDLPVPPPRLRIHYETTVRDRLRNQFGFTNNHQIPNLVKIVVNCGVGEAIKNPKVLDSVVNELSIITGQRPVRKKAKKSIANFGLRQGQEIGAAVTLRGARMWEFFDRFVTVAIPRIRDFRGVNTRSFDG
jgi:large subunit ribosomal protein L5